jgi:N-acetylglucosaminyldiphosphoundecaprenol N-acetyl-beta-D-mannosaminyltransferase
LERIKILGAWIDALTLAEAVERVAAMIREGGPHQVITLNPEILYRATREPALLELINRASLVTADGVGILWAARFAGKKRNFPERVTGIDLLQGLAARAAEEGWRLFLLGGAPGVAEEAAAGLCRQYPGLVVAGTYHGYFSGGGNGSGRVFSGTGGGFPEETEPPRSLTETEVVEMIRRACPHLLFVGMGAPRQEEFIARNLGQMNVPVAMGVGGSFDVLAGRVKRPPAWMRELHLEWLGRLLREPRRWRRMLVLPRFAWLAWREGFRNR